MEEPQTESASPESGFILFFGFLLIFAAMAAVISLGYQRGLGDPDEGPNLLGILILPLGAWVLFSLVRFSNRLKKRKKGGLASLSIALILFLLCGYSTGHSYGGNVARMNNNRDRSLLRGLGGAVEDYRTALGHYPKSLKELLMSPQYKNYHAHGPGQGALPKTNSGVPCSSFGSQYPVHYAMTDSDSSHSAQAWLLWLPGPDRKYDLQDGPELKTAIKQAALGVAVPWLCERTYDPSNGVSSGDQVLNSQY